jgi:sugar lactone lactonase YvrE
MVQDKKGRIFLLTNHVKNNILIYNHKGKLLDSWGTAYPGGHGLTLFDENGTEVLFLTDTDRHQVFKTTLDGKVLLTIDYPKNAGLYTKADEFVPTETAIAPNGDIYVADGYGKDFILVYDSKGNLKYYFGGRGTEDKHLKNAHGITVDYRNPAAPSLVVTSREQNAFKRFTLEGKYISTIPMPGAWVCRPVIKGDYLYAAVLQSNNKLWKESGFITILDKADKVISNPGGNLPEINNGVPAEMFQTDAVFKYPHDVCVDDEGNIYLAQWNSGHVYPFKLKLVH